MSKQTFILIYKSMVTSHLEYGNCVWSPTRITDKKNWKECEVVGNLRTAKRRTGKMRINLRTRNANWWVKCEPLANNIFAIFFDIYQNNRGIN